MIIPSTDQSQADSGDLCGHPGIITICVTSPNGEKVTLPANIDSVHPGIGAIYQVLLPFGGGQREFHIRDEKGEVRNGGRDLMAILEPSANVH